MAAFSRLQLAAALIEYDNDSENSSTPYRSAHDSAIFAHLRRNKPIRAPGASRRSTDYLGVSLPIESGSIAGRDSVVKDTTARRSIEPLRNPFGQVNDEEEGDEDDVEVDLTSWGLDALMSKDKGPKRGRPRETRAKSETFPSGHPVPSNSLPTDFAGNSRKGVRSMSLGDLNQFDAKNIAPDAKFSNSLQERHRLSLHSPLGVTYDSASSNRPASSHAILENTISTAPPHSIPFPSDSVRSRSPALNEDGRLPVPPVRDSRTSSYLSDRPRTRSAASMGSKMLMGETQPNLSAIRGSSHDRDSSRYNEEDPHTRRASNASFGNSGPPLPGDENPFAVRPPSPSRSSKFDPKIAARARTASIGSMGSRALFDNDVRSVHTTQDGRNRPLSTLELLRPKVLVMPSPLQSAVPAPTRGPIASVEGFQFSTDGPPLPPGARSSRASFLGVPGSQVPIASNSFTANPRMSLSLSQLTFRNSLVVDGKRDIAYDDLDNKLPRVTEDGQQATLQYEPSVAELRQGTPLPTNDVVSPRRPAGKLFGKSLIDDLESRKAEMRQKQRVFKGDERPSMMIRSQPRRSSTLIDPSSLTRRPTMTRMNSKGSQVSENALDRRSYAGKPLLNFDDEAPEKPKLSPYDNAGLRSRSVFGVDTLWEREMVKLKEIETEEKREAEEAEQRLAEEKARSNGLRNKKGGPEDLLQSVSVRDSRLPDEPPVLPALGGSVLPERRINHIDSDSADVRTRARLPHSETPGNQAKENWFEDVSDDEDKTKRRRKTKADNISSMLTPPVPSGGDDSEEDLPLSVTLRRAAERASRIYPAPNDDDEDLPLSAVLQKAKSVSSFSHLGNMAASQSSNVGEDDDDKPLGLRASRVPAIIPDDDDMPLGLHPEQQRRTQYQLLAQQQQQMMMQAQMHQSMFFSNPSLVGSAFFNPAMHPAMTMFSPMQGPSPPPSQDGNKLGRVDRWRRDVAVEGTG